MTTPVEVTFERIDSTHSISGMKSALDRLPPDERRAVVLHALGVSRHQFTWSHFAVAFNIPKSDWPTQGMTREQFAQELLDLWSRACEQWEGQSVTDAPQNFVEDFASWSGATKDVLITLGLEAHGDGYCSRKPEEKVT